MFMFMSVSVTQNTCKGGPVLGGLKGYTSYLSHGLAGIFKTLWGGHELYELPLLSWSHPQNVGHFHDFYACRQANV